MVAVEQKGSPLPSEEERRVRLEQTQREIQTKLNQYKTWLNAHELKTEECGDKLFRVWAIYIAPRDGTEAHRQILLMAHGDLDHAQAYIENKGNPVAKDGDIITSEKDQILKIYRAEGYSGLEI
ncbi:MAG: hypothetical protein M1268_01260 [Patescibacteria group bacterium]|nr:hypothetical protein [Patescibacteria group bacterium]